MRLADGKLFSRHKDDIKVVEAFSFGKEYDIPDKLSFVWGKYDCKPQPVNQADGEDNMNNVSLVETRQVEEQQDHEFGRSWAKLNQCNKLFP